jgi:amino acid transporter
MSLMDSVLGRRLRSADEDSQKVGPVAGVAVLGLDALASAAYGPEALLTVLLVLGTVGLNYVLPLSGVIVGLLALVYLSYRQTIGAYPNGGGSYSVAKANLGVRAGLVAAAALMLDYVLVVAVGISAGVGALISVIPSLHPYTLPLGLSILAIITLVNLRGVRESGAAFIIPTYLFVGSLLTVLTIGLVKVLLGDTAPVDPLPVLEPLEGGGAVTLWLLARAFSSGCTAMTGVEAVSNGTPIFRAPNARNARITLGLIVGILSVLLLGIAFLARAYGVSATEPGSSGYESVLSQLVGAVVGKGFFYFVTLSAVIAVLCLSANTGFADFPRLCRVMASDDYLPHAFTERGRRLVFTTGVLTVAVSAGALLIAFGGVTDRLIPLFAVGAFLAFTLSQAGMVVHWRREGRKPLALAINLLGALGTGAALVVVLVSKFAEGAWITLLLIPGAVLVFAAVKRHYESVARQIASTQPLEVADLQPPVVVVPLKSWDSIGRKALRFAMKLSPEVHAVHVRAAEHAPNLESRWDEFVVRPARDAHRPAPKLVELPSPYRSLFGPLLGYISGLEERFPDRQIAVIVPELVERRAFHYLLHNQRATLLKAVLLFRNDRRIVVVNVPWYLDE